MSKAEIRVVTNSMESGDWVKVFYSNDLIFEGHRITPRDLVDIVNRFYSDDGANWLKLLTNKWRKCNDRYYQSCYRPLACCHHGPGNHCPGWILR
jgi:hypothetical protein